MNGKLIKSFGRLKVKYKNSLIGGTMPIDFFQLPDNKARLYQLVNKQIRYEVLDYGSAGKYAHVIIND